jgi:PAS domain S-box
MEPDDNIIDLATERRRRGPRFDGGLMDILEVSRDMVCLCRAGAITAINGAGARMLGAGTTEELVGRRMSEFLVPEYGRMLEMFLAGMASEDKPVPTRILAKDGTVKDVEMQTFRAREIASDATVVVCRETDSEAAGPSHESQAFRLFADNALNMVCRVGGGIVLYINRAGLALLGRDGPQGVIGLPLADLLDGPVDEPALRAAAESGLAVPLSLVAAGGGARPVVARLTLLPSPGGLDMMIEARPV